MHTEVDEKHTGNKRRQVYRHKHRKKRGKCIQFELYTYIDTNIYAETGVDK